MSGATEVVANDVDPICCSAVASSSSASEKSQAGSSQPSSQARAINVAGAALMLNCELNNLHPFPFLTGNLIGSDVCKWDVVVLGDMFYSEELANSLHQWLKKCICAHGTKVLIGDPGRPHFVSHQIQSQLHKITEYALPESTQQENYGSASTLVWNYRP
uniref:Uncharacterized protein n=1 Tax=Sphaerodactylus townsendi TaxID=933632 RepID=A0ACB8FM70_9SAUR